MKRFLSVLLVAMLVLALAIPAAFASEAPAKVLRYATSSVKGAFNPILADDVYDSYAWKLMFTSLVSSDEQLNIIIDDNCIASEYAISDDHLTYSFKLKEGLKFSDGSPITASDVAFTFKMIADKDYDGPRASAVSTMVGYEEYHAGTATELTGINITDDYNIAFTFTEPYVAQLQQTFGAYGILCEEAYGNKTYEEFKAMNATPVGAGPFILDSFDAGQAVNFVRNPNWFGQQPKIDGVTILMIPPETQVMALTSGQCDLVQAPTANRDNYDQMEVGGSKIIQFMGLGYNAMMLNHQSPKLADVKVRKALMHGFDRAGFVENEYKGFARPCLTPVYPGWWAYPSDDSAMDRYEFDQEKAKALLDEAGWTDTNGNGTRDKDGVELDLIMYIYQDSPWPEHLAALLKEQWPQIGVGISTIVADFNTVMEASYDNREFDKFDMWTQGWQLGTDPDPTELLGEEAFTKPGGFNPGGYKNETAWELFKQGRQEYDQTKRGEVYHQWAFIANDDLPMLFNAVRDELWGTGANVTGFEKMSPFYDWVSCIYDVDVQ